jgi:hypothetical protein
VERFLLSCNRLANYHAINTVGHFSHCRLPQYGSLAAARAAPDELNIQFQMVPGGLTHQTQPVDHYVFATLKAIYSRIYPKGPTGGAFARVGNKEFLAC